MSDCDCAQAAPAMLDAERALERLLADVVPLSEIETLPLDAALGRVLARELYSPICLPPADNSAMDGYAVRCADVGDGPTWLPVSQRIAAGHQGSPLAAGSAARIFTGAAVPAGADAVVIQELCETDGERVCLRGPLRPGQNIRRAGEELDRGAHVLAAGSRLRAQELGLAASIGLATLPLLRRPRVAMLVTGDELIEPGEPLRPGCIYNANRSTLTALLRALGCEPIDIGVVADTRAATVEALRAAAEQADLIISSGGVSVGEEDHVKHAVQQLGRIDLWRVRIKPGKPLAWGRVGEVPFLGLPGNPVSMFVTFLLFARPLLRKLAGAREVANSRLRVRAGFDWPQPDRRPEYLRAQVEFGTELVATIPERQGSAMLSSACAANGLLCMPADTPVRAGDTLEFLPFAEFGQ
ncbi:gephyrin-like molybdotransferase Glp [Plasticicumulans acidivorans]|uniref:Molybdopterin molybdenumtransferase n=1 Tax=Plasticicumulans acidivorans TaxID=886464 RepID=A0A317MU36_9GAMM|nr:gephyrin-like molybdotransferase Glp [Plasticicumulans acidivorans]PWV61160.1 molybdopterin molybdotransferase [Plasticicumulans acidivorans]